MNTLTTKPNKETPGKLSPAQISDRIKRGVRWMKKGIADRDNIHCKRFLDGSEAAGLWSLVDTWENTGVLPTSQEVGAVNYLAINILTKNAGIAIGDPDWHVVCDEDEPPPMPQGVDPQAMGLPPIPEGPSKAEIVRQFNKELWRKHRWARTARKGLMKRSISGAGWAAIQWSKDEGSIVEHVSVQDLSIDPSTTDWRKLEWGARRIRMSLAQAQKQYPKHANLFSTTSGDIRNLDDEDNNSQNSIVKIWIYWDQDEEIVLYGENVIDSGPNFYERVPLWILEGDIAPESVFTTGDYDSCYQMQVQIARLVSAMNTQAENGGAIGWYNQSLLDDGSKEVFAEGRPNTFVGITQSPEDAFGFIPGESINPAVIEVLQMQMKALDAGTGVTEYMRGVITQSAKFATEAAMLANQSGARGNQARIEYELFVTDIAQEVIRQYVKFGPALLGEDDEDGMALLDALGSVQEISVLESSTTYKDPAAEMQAASQMAQVLMPFIEGGFVNPVAIIEKILRAFGERNVSKFIQTPPPPPPVQASDPGSPALGQPTAGGASTVAPPSEPQGNAGPQTHSTIAPHVTVTQPNISLPVTNHYHAAPTQTTAKK